MKSEKVENLIMDGTNLCHIHFHGNKGADDDSYIPMTFHTMLNSMKFLYNKFKPERIIIAFDDKHPSWRKLYTKDLSECVTHKGYKSGRNKDKTPQEIERRKSLDENSEFLKEMFEKHTSLITLSRKYLEADDLIAGYVQMHPSEKSIIISSDKDFHQLITDNVRLYNPVSNEFRTLDDYNNDPKLFMFLKCFRGDAGDSVISSYPRLRQNKVFEAYEDDFKRTNILNHTFKVEDINPKTGILETHEYVCKDLFEENELLMDLTKQPDSIKALIKKSVEEAKAKRSKMNMFNFLRFCNRYQLVNIIKDADSFIKPFNLSDRLDP